MALSAWDKANLSESNQKEIIKLTKMWDEGDAETKKIANASANFLRTTQGGYDGGVDGSGNTPSTFTPKRSTRTNKPIAPTAPVFGEAPMMDMPEADVFQPINVPKPIDKPRFEMPEGYGETEQNLGEMPTDADYIPDPTAPTAPRIAPYDSMYTDKINEMINGMENAPSYQSQYAGLINSTITDIANQPKFNYNADNDPAFQAFLARSGRAADKAFNDNLGGLSAMTGGRANSWAGTVASNARGGMLQQAQESVLYFEDRAYSRYKDEKTDMYNLLNVLNAQDAISYSRFRDTISDQKDLASLVLKLDDMAFERYKFSADQEWKVFDSEYVAFRDAVQDKRDRVADAYDRTNMVGYVNNKDSILIGVPAGTLSQSARERIDKMQDYIIQQNVALDAEEYTMSVRHSQDIEVINARGEIDTQMANNRARREAEQINARADIDFTRDSNRVIADRETVERRAEIDAEAVDRGAKIDLEYLDAKTIKELEILGINFENDITMTKLEEQIDIDMLSREAQIDLQYLSAKGTGSASRSSGGRSYSGGGGSSGSGGGDNGLPDMNMSDNTRLDETVKVFTDYTLSDEYKALNPKGKYEYIENWQNRAMEDLIERGKYGDNWEAVGFYLFKDIENTRAYQIDYKKYHEGEQYRQTYINASQSGLARPRVFPVTEKKGVE